MKSSAVSVSNNQVANGWIGLSPLINIIKPSIIVLSMIEKTSMMLALLLHQSSADCGCLRGVYISNIILRASAPTNNETLNIYGAIPVPLFGTSSRSWWVVVTGLATCWYVSFDGLRFPLLAAVPNLVANAWLPVWILLPAVVTWLAPTASCWAPVANCPLPLVSCWLPLASAIPVVPSRCKPVVTCWLPVTNCEMPVVKLGRLVWCRLKTRSHAAGTLC